MKIIVILILLIHPFIGAAQEHTVPPFTELDKKYKARLELKQQIVQGVSTTRKGIITGTTETGIYFRNKKDDQINYFIYPDIQSVTLRLRGQNSVALGALIGAAVGGVAGIMLSPEKGGEGGGIASGATLPIMIFLGSGGGALVGTATGLIVRGPRYRFHIDGGYQEFEQLRRAIIRGETP